MADFVASKISVQTPPLPTDGLAPDPVRVLDHSAQRQSSCSSSSSEDLLLQREKELHAISEPKELSPNECSINPVLEMLVVKRPRSPSREENYEDQDEFSQESEGDPTVLRPLRATALTASAKTMQTMIAEATSTRSFFSFQEEQLFAVDVLPRDARSGVSIAHSSTRPLFEPGTSSAMRFPTCEYFMSQNGPQFYV